MAESRHSTRRAFLKSAPIAAVALSAPVIAVAEELPVDRVNRLASELSQALADFNDGEWHAEVFPANKNYAGIKLVWTDFREPQEEKVRRLVRNLQFEMSKLPTVETAGGVAHELKWEGNEWMRLSKSHIDAKDVLIGFPPTLNT